MCNLWSIVWTLNQQSSWLYSTELAACIFICQICFVDRCAQIFLLPEVMWCRPNLLTSTTGQWVWITRWVDTDHTLAYQDWCFIKLSMCLATSLYRFGSRVCSLRFFLRPFRFEQVFLYSLGHLFAGGLVWHRVSCLKNLWSICNINL